MKKQIVGKLKNTKKWIYRNIWPYFHPVRTLEWFQLKSFAKKCPPSKILSLGCGTGFFEHRLSKIYPFLTFVGCDLSYMAIVDARRYHGNQGKVDFCLADACQLPFMAESFDAVIGVCALEHFYDPDSSLKEIVRILRPNGRLWLSVDAFNHPSIKKRDLEMFRIRHKVIQFYPLEVLSKLLETHGLRIEAYKYLLRSKGSGWVYHINSGIKSRGWEVVEPVLFPFLFLLTLYSDYIDCTKDKGYILSISAKLTNH